MASNYTPNYQLNQWEAEDKVQRTDFNADNAKIDAALGSLASSVSGKADASALNSLKTTVDSKADASTLHSLQSTVSSLQTTVSRKQDSSSALRIKTGSYTGNGDASQTIRVGFAPVAVLVFTYDGLVALVSGGRHIYGGMALAGAPLEYHHNGTTYTAVEITSTGFTAYYKKIDNYYSMNCNEANYRFYYLALG